MKCKYCGKELEEGFKFCDGCGASLDENVERKIENNNYNANNKNGSKIAIIIISIIIVIAIVVAIILLIPKGSKENSSNNQNETNSESEDSPVNNPKETEEEKVKRLIENLSSEIECGLEDPYQKCVLYVTNNNSETVNVIVKNVYLYDSTGEMVGGNVRPDYSNGLGSGKTGYVPIDMYQDIAVAKYEVEYGLQTNFESIDKRDDIEVTSTNNKEKQQIEIVAKNNSDKTVSAIASFVFFYRNNKLVSVQRANIQYDKDGKLVPTETGDIAIIKSGDTVYATLDYPSGKTYKEKLDFDRYEIKIGEAYNSSKRKY